MTEEEIEKLSVTDWTKLMNGYQKRNGPGTVNLDINDHIQEIETFDVPENQEERSIEDWEKCMEVNSQDSHAVNLFNE